MRSENLAAFLVIALAAGCGSGSYGDDGDDDVDRESSRNQIEARDGGWDAGARDGGSSWDAGAWRDASTGASDLDDEDDDEDDDADEREGDAPPAVVDAGGVAGDAGGDVADCASLTYQSFGRQFLSNYCVSCHGGGSPSGGVNLTSLANVVRRTAGIRAQVSSGGMPLGNKRPSAEERAQFVAFLDCGPE